MKKKQRRPSRPTVGHLEESVSTLREDAKDLVLDAARLWKARKGIAWTARVLAAALNVLAGSEKMLGEVVDGESVAPVPNGRARH